MLAASAISWASPSMCGIFRKNSKKKSSRTSWILMLAARHLILACAVTRRLSSEHCYKRAWRSASMLWRRATMPQSTKTATCAVLWMRIRTSLMFWASSRQRSWSTAFSPLAILLSRKSAKRPRRMAFPPRRSRIPMTFASFQMAIRRRFWALVLGFARERSWTKRARSLKSTMGHGTTPSVSERA